MIQQEIKFFWPLTEQMRLDLDYSNCVRLSCTTNASTLTVVNGGASNTIAPIWLNDDRDSINLDKVNFTLNKKPFIIKRLAYKLLGIKWKVK